MISTAALFVNNHIVFMNERRAMLDMRDAHMPKVATTGSILLSPPTTF